jgi:hypothetical protein
MNTFSTKVDTRSRAAMIAFLDGHRRYFIMNSWNGATSYANCVKVHRLGLTPAQLERAWDLLEMPEIFHAIRTGFYRWSEARKWEWSIGFNGRSSGYLVLYNGGIDWHNARTAQCDECGRTTFHKQETPCTYSGCDGTLRVMPRPAPQIYVRPGLGIDEHEDWSEWDLGSLRERARLVQDFDRACGLAVATFAGFCNTYRVVEKTVPRPTRVKVLERV